MDKGQKRIIAVLATLLALVLIAVLIGLLTRDPEMGEFVPPAFEENAKTEFAAPIDANAKYTPFNIPGEFTGALCANVYVEDDQALLYFTSFEENAVWAKAILYNERGKMIGESGLIKPGEHVESVALSEIPKSNSTLTVKTLTVKVLLYEPDTYFSRGSCSISINLIVK